MAILSKRIMAEVGSTFYATYGVRCLFVGLEGRTVQGEDPLDVVTAVRRKRRAALQESLSLGEPSLFCPVGSLSACVVGLEDRRMVHGGVIGDLVLTESATVSQASDTLRRESCEFLRSHSVADTEAARLVNAAPVWSDERLRESADFLHDTFYQVSGWNPELMKENRLRCLQQQQINQAIEDQRRHGQEALYAFEKERVLLAQIRAGDRNAARSILNEMLATIYLWSPRLAVLRARSIELMTCLTRAAIEDNPLLEPLIERNHTWTERLVHAGDFEGLSQVLMDALDDFIDGIYLHGVNRTNATVHQALDYISENSSGRISLETVAREVGLSRWRLAHLVKDLTGRTVTQIIHQVRIRHAQQLLTRTAMSCADIAAEVGFPDQSYFTKHFKRLTGTTPVRYRRLRPESLPV